ncbi:hypothetical protein ES703_87557 [subsurface metagenome]
MSSPNSSRIANPMSIMVYPGTLRKSSGGAGVAIRKPLIQLYSQGGVTSIRIPSQGSMGPVPPTYGTLCRSATVAKGEFTGGGLIGAVRKCTLSRVHISSARVPAFIGSLSQSATISSTGSLAPYSSTYTPPSLLISSTAASSPNKPPVPKPAYMPVKHAA